MEHTLLEGDQPGGREALEACDNAAAVTPHQSTTTTTRGDKLPIVPTSPAPPSGEGHQTTAQLTTMSPGRSQPPQGHVYRGCGTRVTTLPNDGNMYSANKDTPWERNSNLRQGAQLIPSCEDISTRGVGQQTSKVSLRGQSGEEVGHINAHGAGVQPSNVLQSTTNLNDSYETNIDEWTDNADDTAQNAVLNQIGDAGSHIGEYCSNGHGHSGTWYSRPFISPLVPNEYCKTYDLAVAGGAPNHKASIEKSAQVLTDDSEDGESEEDISVDALSAREKKDVDETLRLPKIRY